MARQYTPAQLTAMIDAGYKRQRSKPKNFFLVIETESQRLVRIDKRPPQGSIGQFEGRAGTVLRNTKGTPRRLPNGKRVYKNETAYVVAYKVKPV